MSGPLAFRRTRHDQPQAAVSISRCQLAGKVEDPSMRIVDPGKFDINLFLFPYLLTAIVLLFVMLCLPSGMEPWGVGAWLLLSSVLSAHCAYVVPDNCTDVRRQASRRVAIVACAVVTLVALTAWRGDTISALIAGLAVGIACYLVGGIMSLLACPVWRKVREFDESTTCREYGYLLRGNTSGRCPECGSTWARKAHSTTAVEKMSSWPNNASSVQKASAMVAASRTFAKGRPRPFRNGAQTRSKSFLALGRPVHSVDMMEPSLASLSNQAKEGQSIIGQGWPKT